MFWICLQNRRRLLGFMMLAAIFLFACNLGPATLTPGSSVTMTPTMTPTVTPASQSAPLDIEVHSFYNCNSEQTIERTYSRERSTTVMVELDLDASVAASLGQENIASIQAEIAASLGLEIGQEVVYTESTRTTIEPDTIFTYEITWQPVKDSGEYYANQQGISVPYSIRRGLYPEERTFSEPCPMFAEDFEGARPSWLREPWMVEAEGDNHMACNPLSSDWLSAGFGERIWNDYSLDIQLQFVAATEIPNNGVAEVYLRVAPDAGGYRVSLESPGLVSLGHANAEYVTLGSHEEAILANTWYDLRLEARGEQLRIFLDNVEVIAVQDTRSQSGTTGFGVSAQTQICVDNIRVIDLHS